MYLEYTFKKATEREVLLNHITPVDYQPVN